MTMHKPVLMAYFLSVKIGPTYLNGRSFPVSNIYKCKLLLYAPYTMIRYEISTITLM